MALQREVARALGDPGDFENAREGRARLQELLAERAVLLVLDDVWDRTHAEAFDVLGPRCRMVVTTRDAGLITSLGGTEHQVQLLTEAEARDLLAQWAEVEPAALPPEAEQVRDHCGRLPLALALCGALAREGLSWGDLREALQEADLEFLDHPHGSILRSIKVSVDRLTPEEARRFAELRVFPADETVPEDAVVTLWEHTGDLSERHARRLLTTLERRALVRADGVSPNRRVSLHDLVRDYTGQMIEDDTALHGRLVEAYRTRCPEGWATGPNDGYFFQRLRHHLAEAGLWDELAALLADLRFMEAKCAVGLTYDLVADYHAALGDERLPAEAQTAIEPFGRFVRAHNHQVARRPDLLLPLAYNEAASGRVAETAGRELEGDSRPWLRRWNRPAQPPDAAVQVLAGHRYAVHAVAVTPDGRYVVTGSLDDTARVWDLATGQGIACFFAEAAVWCCAVAPDGLIAAGDQHGNVYFLTLENVEHGPPVVTAWRRPADAPPAFGCLHCRVWSEVPASALGTELPCPHCGRPVKLNPFVIEADWRPVAAA